MNRKWLFWFMLVIGLGLVGCGNNSTVASTEFFRTFSFAEIVNQNEHFLMSGYQGSGGEFGPSEPFIQRVEDIVLHIDEQDIPLFIGALKDDIRAQIKESGGRVKGEASGVSHLMQHFSVSYREGDAFGVINVWGVRGEGTSFYLISDITEYCCSGME